MNKIRRQAKLAAYLLLEKENQILLVKRANTGYEDGKYGLPSGHLEGKETPIECILREAEEEISIKVSKKDLSFIGVIYNTAGGWGEYVDFFFKTSKWKGDVQNCEPEKCSELKWFSSDKLPTNIVQEVKKALYIYKKRIYYSKL